MYHKKEFFHYTGNNRIVADTIDSPITLSIKCNNNCCNKCHIYKSKSKIYGKLCFIIFCILIYIIFITYIINTMIGVLEW